MISSLTVELTLVCLVGLNVIQLFFWAFMVQRLVDKLMSRTYYDYQTAKTLDQPTQAPVKIDDGVPDDLRSLNEIQF